jgi:hypothetical protein
MSWLLVGGHVYVILGNVIHSTDATHVDFVTVTGNFMLFISMRLRKCRSIFTWHGRGATWICIHVKRNLSLDQPCFEMLVLLTYQTAWCRYACVCSLITDAIVWISARVFSLSVANKTHCHYRDTSSRSTLKWRSSVPIYKYITLYTYL